MFKSTRRRLLIIGIIFLFSSFLFSIPSYLLYYNIKTLVIEELGRNARNVAVSVAEMIETDIENYQDLSNIEDYSLGTYDTVYYESLLVKFQELNETIGAGFLYTEKYIDDATVAYVIDAEDPQSIYFSPLGSLDIMCEYERVAYSTKTSVFTPVMDYENWGPYLTGYAPIINSETDEVVGLVGVDFSLDYVSDIIISVRIILILGLVFLTSISSYLIYKLFDLRTEALNKDYLTGLYSKRYQEFKIRKTIKEAKSKNTPLSIMMMDVDYFKEINDSFGHFIGDKVLKEVANVIMYNTRNVDICSRYGGDEFLIILPNTLPEEAAIIGDKIMKSILKVDISDMKSLSLSVSIGIAEWNHESEPNEFIVQADKALYVSKNSGKNKLTIFH